IEPGQQSLACRVQEFGVLPGPLAGEPSGESGHRGKRHEGPEIGKAALKVLDHLLDEKISKGNAGEAALRVRNRVENRRRRLLRANGLACSRQQRGDGVRNLAGERYLHEDKRLVDELGVEEGEAAPVRGLEPPAQIVPPADRMYRLISYDLLQNI